MQNHGCVGQGSFSRISYLGCFEGVEVQFKHAPELLGKKATNLSDDKHSGSSDHCGYETLPECDLAEYISEVAHSEQFLGALLKHVINAIGNVTPTFDTHCNVLEWAQYPELFDDAGWTLADGLATIIVEAQSIYGSPTNWPQFLTTALLTVFFNPSSECSGGEERRFHGVTISNMLVEGDISTWQCVISNSFMTLWHQFTYVDGEHQDSDEMPISGVESGHYQSAHVQ